MSAKIVVEATGMGEREIEDLLQTLKGSLAAEVSIKVRTPEVPASQVVAPLPVFTFVNPDEVGPLLAAIIDRAELMPFVSRFLGHITDLTEGDAPRYRAAARTTHQQDGTIEIDDNGLVSVLPVGAYVQAWVWAGNDEEEEQHYGG